MCYIASNLSWLEKLSFLTIITLIAPFVVFNYKPFLIFSSPFVQIGYYADCIYWNTAARFRFLLQNWNFLDISLRRPTLLRNNFTSRRPFLAWISLFGSQLIHNNSQSSVTKALGELLMFILSTHLVVILKSVFILEQATGDSTGIRRFWKVNQFKFWQKILWLRWLKSIPGN